MILRSIFFILLTASAAFLPVYLFAVAVLMYAFTYTAYELVLLAVFIDGLYSFGHPYIIPYYTLAICFVLICAEWIKPHISGYNQ